MTKIYIKPETTVYQVKIDSQLLSGSPGVNTDDTTGNEYSSSDVTYSKGFFFEPEEIETEE